MTCDVEHFTGTSSADSVSQSGSRFGRGSVFDGWIDELQCWEALRIYVNLRVYSHAVVHLVLAGSPGRALLRFACICGSIFHAENTVPAKQLNASIQRKRASR